MTDDAIISALSTVCGLILLLSDARLVSTCSRPLPTPETSSLIFMMYPPSAQLLVPVATTRMNRPLPFRPSQSHNRNGMSSLGLSYTSTVHSQRTNGSSTKVLKRDDIVEACVLSESKNISDHTPPNGIIISSHTYDGSR